MKQLALVLAAVMIAGCNAAPDPAPAASTPAPAEATPPPPTPTPPPAGEVKRATATGVVQSVDVEAKKITIAHGPVDALGWPGMTMAFDATTADLATIKAGDNVTFEFTSTGMDGTIESISKN